MNIQENVTNNENLIKANSPLLKRIKKALFGLKFVSYEDTPIYNTDNINYDLNYPHIFPFLIEDTTHSSKFNKDDKIEIIEEKPKSKFSEYIFTPSEVQVNTPSIVSIGQKEFDKYYDEVEKENPEAKKYRKFLTTMALKESQFDSYLLNKAGAPAYGYFQFMLDDKTYNNIKAFANTDIETFRNNPKLQIKAAIKLAKQFEKGFTKEDLELAKSKGYSIWGLLGGAWLAGNGGVRKYLRGQGNPSDKHWSKQGKGTDVEERIKLFNLI